ncbi:cytochrome c oxidase assembly factor CtaG [Brevibacillus sp. H7]|uniref:cytochrome c oxidase assembly factor CtaG n=1 Tax=Brevibacillus sp. H7 TaxID=3349138 RepID=UPI003806BEA4
MSLSLLTDTFGFRAVWTPELFALTVLIGITYFLLVGPLRHTFADSQPVAAWRKGMFSIGLLLFYLGMGGPLNAAGHLLFSFHMFQQALLYLVMPLFILIGTPAWLQASLLAYKPVKRLVMFFSKPLLAMVLFNALFSFYHVPHILDAVMGNGALHNLVNLLLIVTAFLMWLPVISPLKEFNRLTELRKLGYMFANGVLITPACALIIFASAPLYETYINGPELLCTPFFAAPMDKSMFTQLLPLLDDQRLGGIVMKLMQEFTYGSVLAYIMKAWFQREKEVDELDQLQPE